MRNGVLALLLPFVLAGCWLGDSVAVKTVSLKFPAQPADDHVTLSVSEPQVQDALRIVDEVMVSHGHHNHPELVSAQDRARGLVAYYGPGGVSFKDNTLDISFVEGHRLHSTVWVKDLGKVLRAKLSDRHGTQNVRVY